MVSVKDVVEWFSVLLNLIFILLIIKEIRLGWVFGIAGSLLSIYLFYSSQLYSEAILYLFYVVMGIYALRTWSGNENTTLHITEWPLKKHFSFLIIGLLATLGLGYFFKMNTDAALPFADAFSTIFSFIATYLEARKIHSTWLYWVVLNAFSVWLYQSRGLEVYALLMVVYAVLSVVGWLQWRKSKLAQSVE